MCGPVGVRHWTDEMDAQTPIVVTRTEQNPVPPNFNSAKFRLSWKHHMKPSTVTSKLPNWALKKAAISYVNLRLNNTPEDERPAIQDFLATMGKIPGGTTEEALFILFRRGCRAHRGLDQFLTKADFNTPYSFIYGEVDWMRALNDGLSDKII